MKKLVLTLIMVIAAMCSQAQTIGDHLNYIRQKNPTGEFDKSEPYSYSVLDKDINSLMIYFLNENLICYQIVIVPQSSTTRQKWISTFNEDWVPITSTRWKFYRDDMSVLICAIDYINNVGSVFSIKEEKEEGDD